LQNNGGDDLTLTADGHFDFGVRVPKDGAYEIQISKQPLWQFCKISNSSGIAVTDTSEAKVVCTDAAAEVSTYAGTAGNVGSADGNGAQASFNGASGVAVDKNGTLFVMEATGRHVRAIDINRNVTTFAGSGAPFSIDGTGIVAAFNNPHGIAIATSGDAYIAETGLFKVRTMTPGATVTTFAGNANSASIDGKGTTASFRSPYGIAVDDAGFLYVTDVSDHIIRKISPAGDVTTLAGSGAPGFSEGAGVSASFDRPSGIAVDIAGNLLVCDTNNNRIRLVKPDGTVTTFAGSGALDVQDGAGVQASFFHPTGVAVDPEGNVFVAEGGGNVLRKITPTGVVTTIAGQAGFVGGADGVGSAARFSQPEAIAIGADGSLFVSDSTSNTIRKIVPVPVP